MYVVLICFCFFFFNDTATTEIYTLSLHDALPISPLRPTLTGIREDNDEDYFTCRRFLLRAALRRGAGAAAAASDGHPRDRKSTRLNSSHANISYAVFCLKKKNIKNTIKILLNQTY